jgi:uncharacterized protein YfeS
MQIIPEYWDDLDPQETILTRKPKIEASFDNRSAIQLKNFPQMIIRDSDHSRWVFEQCLDVNEEGEQSEPKVFYIDPRQSATSYLYSSNKQTSSYLFR